MMMPATVKGGDLTPQDLLNEAAALLGTSGIALPAPAPQPAPSNTASIVVGAAAVAGLVGIGMMLAGRKS